MDHLLDVVAILSFVLAGMVLFSVRRAHIRVEYSVSWLTAAVIWRTRNYSWGSRYRQAAAATVPSGSTQGVHTPPS